LTPEEVVAADPACLAALGLGDAVLARSRTNGFLNMLEAAKRGARAARGDLPRFPSLLISAAGTQAQGAFAEAQDAYLRPDPAAVNALVEVLAAKRIGIVAHFYMDPQVRAALGAWRRPGAAPRLAPCAATRRRLPQQRAAQSP
jgi:quinolinate synthase